MAINRRKQCAFCKKKIEEIDYKDTAVLQKYLTAWSKIKGVRETGNCAKHQRFLSKAIKHARFMALLTYTSR
jgi:small subunit ribosomal protein S18